MSKAINLTPFVVGEFYRIPTVTMVKYGRKKAWPVIGPLHEDADVIGFEWNHYHIDARFVTDNDLKLLYRNYWRGDKITSDQSTFAVVLDDEGHGDERVTFPDVVFKVRMCRRVYAEYPTKVIRKLWLPKLEAKYANHKIDERLICPHKRAPLAGLTPDAHGCVTCPLHGLRWNCKTGDLAGSEAAT